MKEKNSNLIVGGENLSLYILKAICALFVVLLHIPSISFEGAVLQPILRIAVPCFLMISGYYIVSDRKIREEKVKRQCRKIVQLLIVGNLAFAGFVIVNNIILNQPIFPIGWQTPKFWINLILFGDVICYPFWYLTSYFQALLLIWCCIHYRCLRMMYVLVPFFLIGGILLNRYSFVFTDIILDVRWSRNTLFCAIPCVLLGSMVRLKNIRIERIKTVVFLLVAASYVELATLHYFNIDGSGSDFNLSTYPLAFSVFLYCVQYPNAGIISEKLRGLLINIGKYSAVDIYMYHVLVFSLLKLLVTKYETSAVLLNAEVVFMLCLLFSYAFKYKKMIWSRK